MVAAAVGGAARAYERGTLCRKSSAKTWLQVGHVQAERDVLAASDNAWVVGLEYSFQDDVNLYMVSGQESLTKLFIGKSTRIYGLRLLCKYGGAPLRNLQSS